MTKLRNRLFIIYLEMMKMRGKILRWIGVIFLMLPCSSAVSEQTSSMIQILKSHLCDDGASVDNVLSYAQKVTKNCFMPRGYSLGYDSKHIPYAVCFEFNMMPNMDPDDTYASCWKISADGKSVSPDSASANTVANILQSGKEVFASYVNDVLMSSGEKYNNTYLKKRTYFNGITRRCG